LLIGITRDAGVFERFKPFDERVPVIGIEDRKAPPLGGYELH